MTVHGKGLLLSDTSAGGRFASTSIVGEKLTNLGGCNSFSVNSLRHYFFVEVIDHGFVQAVFG
jgi:hypothetical protein